MHKEVGERRDFLPELVAWLDREGASQIILEHGYGSGMDVGESEYLEASPRARFGDYDACLAADIVLVVRCPDEAVFERMRRGSVLFSMLHYPTRPGRVAKLMDLGIHGISLDGLMDDEGHRLIENLRAVGWNGVREAFKQIELNNPDFADIDRSPIRVTVLGAGAVGSHAIAAAIRYGDPARRESLARKGVPGVEVTVVDYDLTRFESHMLPLLERTDLLIDATYRPDATIPVIPNPWIGSMKEGAILLDLSVDPYDFSTDPPQVKGMEGIPGGTLDQWVFSPEDPAWSRLGDRVDARNRRLTLSCYSWPGIEPRDCMELYGRQVAPMMRVLINRSVKDLDLASPDEVERAVARAEVSRWLQSVSMERDEGTFAGDRPEAP